MKRLLELLRLLFGGSPTPPPLPPPPPTPTPDPNAPQASILDAHNKERAAKGLPALKANQLLMNAAALHAKHMARVGRMAHQGIGDGTPWTRIDQAGYSLSSGGENVAWNQQTVGEVMRAWMNSSGHRANILGNFTEFGGAIAYGAKSDPYWCTVFATPRTRSFFVAPVEMYLDSAGTGMLIPAAAILPSDPE